MYGVATFYHGFFLEKRGKHIISICQGTACHVKGGENILNAVKEILGIDIGETTPDGRFTLQRVACLGCCSIAPVAVIDDKIIGNCTVDKIKRLIEKIKEEKKIEEETFEKEKIDIKGVKFYVGLSSCGIARGADKIYKFLKSKNLNVEKTGCSGNCYVEPVVEIEMNGKRIMYSNVDIKKIKKILNEIKETKKHPEEGRFLDYSFFSLQKRQVLSLIGKINPEKIKDYIKNGGYSAWEKAKKMKPMEIIEILKKSNLRGRGGAGFPTWKKWQLSALNSQLSTKFLICNADEGDPGAFMDRSILEGNPHLVLEGMLIGMKVIGAKTGIFYIREEYPLAVKRVEIAIKQAKKLKIIPENYSIEIVKGAGAFVCGEETALIQSIEGKRGMPYLRPPFPVEKGLFGMPTVINNVETLANVPIVINKGENFINTKVFALAGKAKRVGLIEVPIGTKIKDLVEIAKGENIKAIQIGGPSGGCIPKELFDVEVDYEKLTSLGAIMGSGGLILLDENTCMVDIAKYFLSFTQKESCGKCVACREGTKRMLEILERITEGKADEDDLIKLENLANMIKQIALCGLGQTAPNPVLTTLKYFKNEYLEHIRNKKCPAGVCRSLIKFEIIEEKCTGCTLCKNVCPVNAIEGERRKVHKIKQDLCIKCSACYNICPFNAIKKS
ncbi:MAG: NADH-quinone oxidoreductase subunit F [Caldiserica bacterium]|nr:MAG: NADH-quinone oxidoreductase subunit F [Caldisericota bacterium]